MAESLSSFLASEANLIQEASEALPHQFSDCTYALGPIRQAVYLCLTCDVTRGICSSCSIACHTDHEQIELYPKRNFRCDCPTEALAHQCTLHKSLEGLNESNVYGQNYKGVFCRCGRKYDAKTERETMAQCLACEDWFHESCLNLRERPTSRDLTPVTTSNADKGPDPPATVDDDAISEASSSGLPPPLITESDYSSFICRACVLSNSTLRRWAGTKGVMMVTRSSSLDPWRVLDGSSGDDSLPVVNGDLDDDRSAAGMKRPGEHLSSTDAEGPQTKKQRVESNAPPPTNNQTCLAPFIRTEAQQILGAVSSEPPNFDRGAGDIFLTDGWRGRWCHCPSCLPPLQAQPFLLEEEETYEPPEDPDSAFSLEDLGMRALQRLPRDRALDGIRAYNEMRDELLQYLRPFAQEGKVVNEEDVRNFFEAKTEAAKASREA